MPRRNGPSTHHLDAARRGPKKPSRRPVGDTWRGPDKGPFRSTAYQRRGEGPKKKDLLHLTPYRRRVAVAEIGSFARRPRGDACGKKTPPPFNAIYVTCGGAPPGNALRGRGQKRTLAPGTLTAWRGLIKEQKERKFFHPIQKKIFTPKGGRFFLPSVFFTPSKERFFYPKERRCFTPKKRKFFLIPLTSEGVLLLSIPL